MCQRKKEPFCNAQGEFLSQWYDVFAPTDIFIDYEETVYVAELSPGVSIFTIDGKLLACWDCRGLDRETAISTAIFLGPHAVAVDSQGDLYVGDVPMDMAGVDRGSGALLKFARRT